jgi:hypothetical protein
MLTGHETLFICLTFSFTLGAGRNDMLVSA